MYNEIQTFITLYMNYDQNNIFAKIIRNELHSEKIFEDDDLLVIKDKFPQHKIHLLCLSKKPFISFDDFVSKSSIEEIGSFFQKIQQVSEKIGLSSYRILSNHGKSIGQEVMHFHVHLVSN